MFIDTHCHLNFPQYDSDRAMVIGNAKKAGVKQFVNPGVDSFSSNQAVELAQKHPGVVFASVGFHPYEAQQNPDVGKLERLLSEPPSRSQSPPGRWPKDSFQVKVIVAIGECGLDYHIYKGEEARGRKDTQKRLFEWQLELAVKYHLPVIIHCRDAFADLFDVLDSLPRPANWRGGVLHCFSGGLQEIRLAQECNLYIGIDGNITYSKHLQMIASHIPLSLLLLETDGPYLTPTPHRGQRNQPKYIPLIAKKIAELKNVPIKAVEESTTANARSLFSL